MRTYSAIIKLEKLSENGVTAKLDYSDEEIEITQDNIYDIIEGSIGRSLKLMFTTAEESNMAIQIESINESRVTELSAIYYEGDNSVEIIDKSAFGIMRWLKKLVIRNTEDGKAKTLFDIYI